MENIHTFFRVFRDVVTYVLEWLEPIDILSDWQLV